MGRKRKLPPGVRDRTAEGKGYEVAVGKDPLTGRRVFENYQDPDEAIDRKHEAEKQRRDGAFVSRTKGDITIAAYAAIADITAPLEGQRRQQTADRDESLMRNHVIGPLGEAKLRYVSADDLLAWTRGLSALGLNPDTVRKCYCLLRELYARAARAGYVAASPCVLRAKELPKATKREREVPGGVEQIDAFREALPARYRAMVGVGVWGGLRIGEICGLRVKDFDPKTGYVQVRGTMVELKKDGYRPTYQPQTKTTGSAKTVALPEDKADELAGHIEKYTDGRANSFIFTASDEPSRGLTNQQCLIRVGNFRKRVWRDATAKANARLVEEGLPELPQDWTTHRLRGTGSTWMAASTTSLIEIGEHLRHEPGSRATGDYIKKVQGAKPRVNRARPSVHDVA